MAEPEKKKKRRSPVKWFKELFSELKKVTWPTFPQVVKQTGIVLLVTLLFLLVLLGMDALFGYLFGLLKSGLSTTAALSTLRIGAFPLRVLGGLASLL